MRKLPRAPMLYDAIERLRLSGRDAYFGLTRLRNWKRGYTKAPLVLCNSYPKSGTHLLAQILLRMPGVNSWNDIVSVQSLSGVMNTTRHIYWKIASAPPGALVRSHLMYTSEVLELLARFPMKRLFIYRDLRDVAVSHANWVLKEPGIFLHSIYRRMGSFEDCLMASIVGTPLGTPFGSNVSQPDIGTDFRRWRGWLSDPGTLSVRFEDLVGERGGGLEMKRLDTVREICRLVGATFPDQQLGACFGSGALDPAESHTFRKGNMGAIGGWRSKFTEAHKRAFKAVAGDLLVQLGYETDLDW